MTINGTSNGQHEQAAVAQPGFHRVELYRVETLEPVFVRLLSPDYKGIFTHYYQKRSHYCIGDGCKIANHATDRTWKGYCAAERLLVCKKPVWVPICLEITEYLELDFRGVFERGQTWELYKVDNGRGKKGPVSGKKHPDQADANLRRPFDILPCLRAIYHRDVIDLRHGSPLPARVYVEEMPAELPEVLKPKAKENGAAPDYSYADEFRRRQQELAEAKQSPSDKKKARGY